MMRFVTFSFCVLPSISVGGFMENKSACENIRRLKSVVVPLLICIVLDLNAAAVVAGFVKSVILTMVMRNFVKSIILTMMKDGI